MSYFPFLALGIRDRAALSYAIQHMVSRKLTGIWGKQYFNTRFPHNNLLHIKNMDENMHAQNTA